MEKENKKTIKIAQIMAPIVSSRDLLNNILVKIITETDSRVIDFDFINVEFISRSAAHALLSIQEEFREKKEILFTNTNKDVKEMIRMVAASRILPKEDKPKFTAEKIDINKFSQKLLQTY